MPPAIAGGSGVGLYLVAYPFHLIIMHITLKTRVVCAIVTLSGVGGAQCAVRLDGGTQAVSVSAAEA